MEVGLPGPRPVTTELQTKAQRQIAEDWNCERLSLLDDLLIQRVVVRNWKYNGSQLFFASGCADENTKGHVERVVPDGPCISGGLPSM
jgi:hypothetical protein